MEGGLEALRRQWTTLIMIHAQPHSTLAFRLGLNYIAALLTHRDDPAYLSFWRHLDTRL